MAQTGFASSRHRSESCGLRSMAGKMRTGDKALLFVVRLSLWNQHGSSCLPGSRRTVNADSAGSPSSEYGTEN
jgi:hypothetical protein